MPDMYEIRADFDQSSIIMYQAYNDTIANAALSAQTFVSPFSFNRMTWIKPSFLWLMHRSQWGQKSGQQRTLKVRMLKDGWEKALSLGILTSPVAGIHESPDVWNQQFREAKVHVQWDTERSLRGAALTHYSIQVGLSREVIREYVERWIISIEDLTPIVDKIRNLLRKGEIDKAKRLLPSEQVYHPDPAVAKCLQIKPQ